MNCKPTDEQVAALARLATSAEWPVIEAWLLTNREECVQRSLSPEEVRCRQAQGSLQAIDSFLRNTRAAKELASSR